MSVELRPCGFQRWAFCDGNCWKCRTITTSTTITNPTVEKMADGHWYHGNGKVGGEFHPTKPNDKERYGEYVKVKHGRWIEDEYGIPHCSECKAINLTVYRNYCPNCGADMRGGEND